jgi:hypothetical protein
MSNRFSEIEALFSYYYFDAIVGADPMILPQTAFFLFLFCLDERKEMATPLFDVYRSKMVEWVDRRHYITHL